MSQPSPKNPWLVACIVCAGLHAALFLTGCGDAKRMGSTAGLANPAERGQARAEKDKGGPEQDFNTEAYDRVFDNPFHTVAHEPLSTFSIDVDTASYSNVRRFLQQENRLPPKDAVRIEELVNYFRYDHPEPKDEHPVAITTEVSACPWNAEHRLVRIGLQAKRIHADQLPPRNLVFLIDVSGSMNAPNRLPLVKKSLEMLVEQLTARDHVAIVVYAGHSGLVLSATPGNQKPTILDSLRRLEAGGSTNGGEGIQLAYKVAQENLIADGVNRVILATDGDFNVGVTSQGDLLRMIEQQRKTGIFLTILGYGMGNLKDSTLEKLADHGNGHYAYIDTIAEARKVFVEEGAALVTVAKDVKVQVEFNPAKVGGYRLIGYENRLLHAQDFNDDLKDAGDMGAGHTVTALYECVPPGKPIPAAGVDPLKYQQPARPTVAAESKELLTVKVRYKEPKAEQSQLLSRTVDDAAGKLDEASRDHRFAAGVAAFGMLLRDSPYKGSATYELALELARGSGGNDPGGYRSELVRLIEIARSFPRSTTPRKGQD